MAFTSFKEQWQPHQYQLTAVQWLISRGGAGLFLDPGLGKTSVTLAAYKILRDKGIARKALVVAPRRPMYEVWPAEINKWADFEDITYVVLHGSDKEEALEIDADIYIINPEGLAWLFTSKRFEKLNVDILIADELSKFKHSQTQRFKLIKPYLPKFQRRWGLTGTPASNGLMDLFGECYMLDCGNALGRFVTHFRNNYFIQSGFGGYEYKPRVGAYEQILERIKPLALHMQAEDYLQLPELVYQDVKVRLDPAAMGIYKTMEDAFFVQLESEEVTAVSASAVGIKCRQIANGAVYNDNKEVSAVHNEKLDALESLLEELNGQPALVLYEFNHDKDRILERFPGAPYIGGGQSDKKVSAYIMEFNAGTLPVLLAHPASAGHGLNLQKVSNHVIWFGLPWDLELYDQALRRVYRQGNPNTHVFIHHIVAEKTLDEKVLKVLKQKDRLQRNFLAALKEERGIVPHSRNLLEEIANGNQRSN
jgi:SNF2 family DNA or RNA helicase